MSWYALTGLLAIAVLIIENYDIIFYKRDKQGFPQIQIYRRFLFAVLAYYITDMMWGILDSQHLIGLLFADTVIYYVAMAVGVLFWTKYVVAYLAEDNAFSRFLTYAGRLLFAAVVAVTVINCFTPVLFWFDEDGIYHACPARHVQLGIQILLPALTSLYALSCVSHTKGADKGRYRTISLFGLSVAVLLFVQLYYPLLPLYTIGYMIGVSLLHTFVVSEEMEEYRRESELAVAASRAKSSFLSNMSHEIRTPINAVLGMNEMILRESSEKNIIEYSENIRMAGGTLLRIINDILDFSKIEAGKMELIPVDYDLSSVLNDLTHIVSARAGEKGLALKLDFDTEIPKMLHGDEVRIKQIIMNILVNAVKYTEKGGITFKVGFERISGDDDHINLFVSVSDTGIGIKPEDVDKLFIQFERIEEKRNRGIEGTGLGMNITKSLLEMMGSHLEVKSVYGEGSEFSFSVMQKVVAWDKLGDYENSYRAHLMQRKRNTTSFSAPDATVLAVDDNPMNLMVFKSLLKRTDIRIDMASDGDEGIRLASDKKYDLIFLDHMMPDKDGIETLHELRSNKDNPNLKTPTVCLTANAISGAREKYIEEGFDDYLTKPIDADALEKALLRYLPAEKVKQVSGSEQEENETDRDTVIPDELSGLAGQDMIDIKAGIENSGSAEDYMQFLQVFYRSIDEKRLELDGFYAAQDYKNYTIKVHALKSSARIIGAFLLGEEAQALENAGKKGDTDYIRDHHESFLNKLDSMKEPLSGVFSRNDENAENSMPEADEEMMLKFLSDLSEAAGIMDIERIDEVFELLKDRSIPDNYSELYKNLRKAADDFDYGSMVELLKHRA
ncbi:MAG: response regulator [Lachnospiraceae bacterium]|nr:response regulator [Lachnospiraceae bacterium]